MFWRPQKSHIHANSLILVPSLAMAVVMVVNTVIIKAMEAMKEVIIKAMEAKKEVIRAMEVKNEEEWDKEVAVDTNQEGIQTWTNLGLIR